MREAQKGFNAIAKGQVVQSDRFLQGPTHDLRLDLPPEMVRPNVIAQAQYQRHEVRVEAMLAAEATEVPEDPSSDENEEDE